MKTIIAHGAEAIITRKKSKSKDFISKHRVKKSYRYPALDSKIRRQRTRREARILERAGKIIPIPKVLKVDEQENIIDIEYIEGKRLSDHLEKLNYKAIGKQIGINIARLHDAGIIHGDLTTSNMILSKRARSPTISKNEKLYFIDFGLGFHSDRVEDKAVDLHLISQALEAKHPSIFEKTFKSIIQSYKKTSKNAEAVLIRLQKVEKRGRYKKQY